MIGIMGAYGSQDERFKAVAVAKRTGGNGGYLDSGVGACAGAVGYRCASRNLRMAYCSRRG